jgi:oligopeptide transport system substrate-binding protein
MGCNKTPPSKNCLRLSINEQPSSLDPRKADNFSSSTIASLLYEGLTRCLPGGGIEPALAQSFTISPDEKTYTFHLRKAFWSDGKQITAHDFANSWKQILHPPGACAPLFYAIKNVEKCIRGEVPVESVGIYTIDDLTLQVELEQPTPYFYSLTAFPCFFAAPSHTDNPFVCSGPFRLDSKRSRGQIVLKKNEHFWNFSKIFLNEIRFSIVPDEVTALQMFEQKDLDWIGGSLSPIPLDALEQYKDKLLFIPNAATTFCAFNTSAFPLNNMKLRKALCYAINREEITREITQTGQHPADSFLPPPFATVRKQLFEPDLAKQLLNEALQELNIEPSQLELTLHFKVSQLEKRVAQTLQRHWKEILGLDISLIQMDAKSITAHLHARNYQICLTAWIAQFDDPISILERFKNPKDLKNYSAWENQKYTEILNASFCSKEREKQLSQAEQIFSEEVPIAPIYHWKTPVIKGNNITSIETTPCGGILFERFKLEEEPQEPPKNLISCKK